MNYLVQHGRVFLKNGRQHIASWTFMGLVNIESGVARFRGVSDTFVFDEKLKLQSQYEVIGAHRQEFYGLAICLSGGGRIEVSGCHEAAFGEGEKEAILQALRGEAVCEEKLFGRLCLRFGVPEELPALVETLVLLDLLTQEEVDEAQL